MPHLRFLTCAFVVVFAASTIGCSGGASVGGSPSAPGKGSSAVSPASPAAQASAVPSVAESPTATPPAGAASTAVVPFPASSDPDPFYAQPNPESNLPAGTILASRSATYALGGVSMPNTTYQLKFVSHDVNGNPIAAVATVVEPLVTPTGTPVLYSLQFAEDSLGLQCSPSHNVTGSTSDYLEQAEGVSPNTALKLGWTVVFPDHEGPTAAFAAGRSAGQITLDGVRAAERFAPLGLSVKTPVGLSGYSGGAIATSWAASLQKAYAPELNVVGVATGGTPADLIDVTENIDSNVVANAAFFSLILSAVVGVNRAYPQLITPILNTAGTTAATELENGCVGADSNGSAGPTGQLTQYTTTGDPFDSPGVVATIPYIDLPQPNNVPVANVFVYHSQVDELIPIEGADVMVAAWCKAGSEVEYYRGVTGDHVAFEASEALSVIAYFTSRFNGTATVVPPGSTTCN